MKARAVNLKREEYDVRVDRRTKWGNPFIIGRDGNREEVVRKYREFLLRTERGNQLVREARLELKGKRLGCHCAPHACHADVLAEAAESKGRAND